MGGKELILNTCSEIGITQKELAEKIGANDRTVLNWGYKDEVPLWAEKSINLLLENYRNGKIIRNLKEINFLIQKIE